MKPLQRKPRRRSLFIPFLIHIAAGVLLTVMAVLVFIDTEQLRALFPLIFFLAAAVLLADGAELMRRSAADGGKKKGYAVFFFAGVFFLVIAAFASITVFV